MSSPWAKLEQSESEDLRKIISQEVTRKLQAKEGKKYPLIVAADPEIETCNDSPKDFDNKLNDDEEEVRDWDTYELSQRDQIESKYDAAVTGKKHTSKLSRKVFNSLDNSYGEEFQRYKVARGRRKRPSSSILGIDKRTCYLISKMIKDKIFTSVTDIISFDKEYVIIRAKRIFSLQCCVKVFKSDKGGLTACQKARNEVANYKKLKAAGIPCVNIMAVREHILVTPYYKLLKDEKYYDSVYDHVKKMMYRFYNEANLIHGNLSENNILHSLYGSCSYFINISQSVERSHENAFQYLFNDCTSVIKIFRREDKYIEEPDDLFKYITGYSFLNRESLLELQSLVKK